MPKFPQPCSVCGILSRAGSMCEPHQQEAKRKKELTRYREMSSYRAQKKSQLYNYAYRKQAKLIRETATHCHICKEPFKDGDRIEADHLIPGSNEGGLAAAHRLCNQQRGAKPL